MDSEKQNPSQKFVEDIRRTTVSRRGGVRVRGGRLPPIRIPKVPQCAGAKKSIAPNIPQRRIKVKEENTDAFGTDRTPNKFEERAQPSHSRGRRRGNKTFIQTEGVLGIGPAAQIKKERIDFGYEKSNISRSSKSEKKCKIAFDHQPCEKDVKELLEDYDEDEPFSASDGIHPVRLPFPKLKRGPKIKQEQEDLDFKANVQVPVENKWTALEGKFFHRIKLEEPAEYKKVNDLMNCIQSQGDSLLLLFQLPKYLPFQNVEEGSAESNREEKPKAHSEKKEKQTNDEKSPFTFADGIPEGCVGKLQVLKSGRMRLLMGSLAFQVESTLDLESLMEVVSIRIREGNDGSLISLGKIEIKMIVRPSSTTLLKKASA